MNGAGDQLLAGSAFAQDQNVGVGRRHLRDLPLQVAHLGARTQHVVFELEFGLKPLVLLLQPAQNSGVLPSARGHLRHGGNQLQMTFIEPARRIGGFEINHGGQFTAHHHRRAQLGQARTIGVLYPHRQMLAANPLKHISVRRPAVRTPVRE